MALPPALMLTGAAFGAARDAVVEPKSRVVLLGSGTYVWMIAGAVVVGDVVDAVDVEVAFATVGEVPAVTGAAIAGGLVGALMVAARQTGAVVADIRAKHSEVHKTRTNSPCRGHRLVSKISLANFERVGRQPKANLYM